MVFVHPGEEEEGGEQRAAEMRQEFSSSFTTTHFAFVVLGVCVLRGEAFRDAFRARGGAMKRCENAFRRFPIAIASHRAMDFSARNADDFVLLPIVFEEKDDKKEGK